MRCHAVRVHGVGAAAVRYVLRALVPELIALVAMLFLLAVLWG
jgi:hypothetical protein